MSALRIQAAIAGLTEEHTERFLDVIDSLSGTDLSVVLTHVYDEDDKETLEETFDIDSQEPAHLDIVANHNTAIQHLRDALDERGIECDVRGSLGDPTTEVLRIADEEDVDFVLIGGRKRSPTGKALFGSTSQEILLNSTRPVVFVNTEAAA